METGQIFRGNVKQIVDGGRSSPLSTQSSKLTMKKYDNYKDSGVEWLGEIPEGWQVKRLASFGKFSKGGGFAKKDLKSDGLKAVLYGDIYTKYNYLVKDAVRHISNETAIRSVEIKRGDILFTGSGETKEDIGKCVLFDGRSKNIRWRGHYYLPTPKTRSRLPVS